MGEPCWVPREGPRSPLPSPGLGEGRLLFRSRTLCQEQLGRDWTPGLATARQAPPRHLSLVCLFIPLS